MRRLREAVAELPPRTREIFRLNRLEGLTPRRGRAATGDLRQFGTEAPVPGSRACHAAPAGRRPTPHDQRFTEYRRLGRQHSHNENSRDRRDQPRPARAGNPPASRRLGRPPLRRAPGRRTGAGPGPLAGRGRAPPARLAVRPAHLGRPRAPGRDARARPGARPQATHLARPRLSARRRPRLRWVASAAACCGPGVEQGRQMLRPLLADHATAKGEVRSCRTAAGWSSTPAAPST